MSKKEVDDWFKTYENPMKPVVQLPDIIIVKAWIKMNS